MFENRILITALAIVAFLNAVFTAQGIPAEALIVAYWIMVAVYWQSKT